MQIYELTCEYYKRIFFLPPFSIFFYIVYFTLYLIDIYRKKKTKTRADYEDILGMAFYHKRIYLKHLLIFFFRFLETQLAKEKIANWEKEVVANKLILNSDTF